MAAKKFTSTQITNLDLRKFENFIKDNGIQHTKLSVDMGYDQTYLSGVLHKKFCISKPALKMFCLLTNSKEEDFLIVDTPQPTHKVEEPKVSNTTINAISPEQMDALIGALNAHTEVLDRIYGMLEVRLKAIQFPLDKASAEFRRFSLAMGTPDDFKANKNTVVVVNDDNKTTK